MSKSLTFAQEIIILSVAVTINRHFLHTLCAMVLLADVAPAPGCSSRTRTRPPPPQAEVTASSDDATHAAAPGGRVDMALS